MVFPHWDEILNHSVPLSSGQIFDRLRQLFALFEHSKTGFAQEEWRDEGALVDVRLTQLVSEDAYTVEK